MTQPSDQMRQDAATALQIAEAKIIAASGRVLARLQAEFEELKVSNPERARSFDFGFGNAQNQLGPDGGPHEQAPVKYLLHARGHVRKYKEILPHLMGPRKVFEIGVGPGHLASILLDGCGVDVEGCDIDFDKTVVYREIRRELGLAPRMHEHAVKAFKDIPIPEGAEAVYAFWTAFNGTWGVPQHEWFLDYCRERLSGPKVLALRFNRYGFNDKPEVMDLYDKIGEFPIRPIQRDPKASQAHEDNFCIVRL